MLQLFYKTKLFIWLAPYLIARFDPGFGWPADRSTLRPVDFRMLSLLEGLLVGGIWIVASTVLAPLEGLMKQVAQWGVLGKGIEDGFAFGQVGLMIWAIWFFVRLILTELIRYVVSGYGLSGDAFQQTYRFIAAATASILVYLLVVDGLGQLPNADKLPEPDFAFERQAVQYFAALELVYLPLCIWFHYRSKTGVNPADNQPH